MSGLAAEAYTTRVVLAWHRFGPYHHARAGAAAKRLSVVGLEMATVDHVNAWAPVETAKGFDKITLCPDEAVADVAPRELLKRLMAALSDASPQAVVVHGYANRDALALLVWAIANNRPAILMSESNASDERRIWWREWLKRRLVGLFSAGLVGGTASKDYLQQLGLSPGCVFLGYDAVDNAHFAADAASPKLAFPGLSQPFFMASGRFIKKKNFFRLIDAFARYQSLAGSAAWQLVVIGDGELRPEIEGKLAELQLGAEVFMPGYKQYDELPAWYGAASCFIHPSTTEQWGLVVNEAMAAGLPVLISERCGCASDLVREGVNGFTFNPYDVSGMADLMFRIAHGDLDRAAMGRSSQQIIANWGPERFAEGLESAVEAALSAPPLKPTPLDKALLWALIHR